MKTMIKMKRFLLSKCVFALLLFSVGCSKKDQFVETESTLAGTKSKVTTSALHTYYVATNGSDTNPGTFEQPFLTITKAQATAVAGDDIYFRGGTYVITEAMTNRIETTYNRIFYMNKSGTANARIQYMNYPGESPILDFSNVQPSGKRVTAIHVVASYLTFKGLDIKGVQQTLADGQSECIRLSGTASNNVFENLKFRDGEANGFYLYGSQANNLVLNCDAYNNYDPIGDNGSGGNTDGFGVHPNASGPGNVLRGCRSWFNSDDGFDCISAYSAVTFENCWSFYNGYTNAFVPKGNGLGFKVGGYGLDGPYPSPAPRHRVLFCLSVYNKTAGFYANHHNGGIDWISNTAYKNPTNYNMLNRNGNLNQDVPGFDHTMYNNLGYAASSSELTNIDLSKCTTSNNYFNLSGQVTINAADFESLDETLLSAPRNADNTLPQTAFARLASGSDLIDKGFNAGFPFAGTAPDLGSFEFAGGTPPPTPPAAPSGLAATADDAQASLSWTPVSGASSYNVKRSTTSGGPYTTVATGVTASNYTNTGLTNGTTYYYVVSAVNSAGESANSSEANAMPQATLPPAAPSGLIATAGNRRVSLSWTAVSGATSYNVKRSTSSGGPYTTVATGVTSISYINSGLTNGTTYYFVVSAVNSGGQGVNSSQVSAVPRKT